LNAPRAGYLDRTINLVTPDEVQRLAAGEVGGRIQR
jgi:hypothetical protein